MAKRTKNTEGDKSLFLKLSEWGNTIGGFLKWGTVIGVFVGIVVGVRDIKTMIYADHNIIKDVPSQIYSIQRANEIRWEEQKRLDEEQNKKIANPELDKFMIQQTYTTNKILEELEKQKKNQYYSEEPITMTEIP